MRTVVKNARKDRRPAAEHYLYTVIRDEIDALWHPRRSNVESSKTDTSKGSKYKRSFVVVGDVYDVPKKNGSKDDLTGSSHKKERRIGKLVTRTYRQNLRRFPVTSLTSFGNQWSLHYKQASRIQSCKRSFSLSLSLSPLLPLSLLLARSLAETVVAMPKLNSNEFRRRWTGSMFDHDIRFRSHPTIHLSIHPFIQPMKLHASRVAILSRRILRRCQENSLALYT